MQPEHCYVRRGWIGMILSECKHLVHAYHNNRAQRTKEGLSSGQIPANGDAWPKFLYAGYKREKGRSWKGLFRSPLLVNVFYIISAFLRSVLNQISDRLSSLYSRVQARSRKKNSKPRVPGTLGFMA